MRPPGTFRINSRARAFDDVLDPFVHGERRVRRIVDSLRHEILESGTAPNLRIRQIFENPREIYRVELELPEMSYQRVTLLDREALETLLETAEVRAMLAQTSG